MRSDKRNRAMQAYTGFAGTSTVAHVERSLLSAYPQASQELSGRQYGAVMSACNKSYHDGAANATASGEVWDYVSPTDWIAGIGKRVPNGAGGYHHQAIIEVAGNTITITTADGNKLVYTLAE